MKFSARCNKSPLLCALTLTLLHSVTSSAQTPPNAGQILRELQQQPDLTAPKAGPSVEVEERALNTAVGDETSFDVKTILISGSTAIPTATLQSLVADLEGRSRTLKDLNAATARITSYYREHGYPVARAYLPAQEIKNGTVTIAIVEGRISAHQLKNQSRLSDERAAAYLDQVRDGETIRSDRIDRGLLLLNDTPGVSNARATLQPGASVGTSDLVVQLEQGAAYNGSVDFDNYGNRYVGEYRLSGTLNVNSPLKIGDVLIANVLTSGDGLNYGRVAYQLPVGSDGLRIGAAYFETRYELGKEFKSLDAHGTASSTSVFAAYPFIRSQLTNLNGTLSWEKKMLSDSVDATLTTTDKSAKLMTAGIYGTRQDAFGGGGINSMSLSAIFGQLDIKSPSALIIDKASAKTNGSYARVSYNLARLQRLNDSNTLYVTVYGQEASKNLDSSEKFALGGATGVRAYPQGEGIGDEGVLATVELRHNFNAALQGTLFYDTGSVKINHTPFGPAAPNTRALAGVGVGLNTLFSNVQIKASLAWRISNEDPISIPQSAVHTPTLWVQASIGF
ncbi:MAG: ShlB/FhaC/HecB family hemolysin secretion/activation protein [Pseudomonadota bacterium]